MHPTSHVSHPTSLRNKYGSMSQIEVYNQKLTPQLPPGTHERTGMLGRTTSRPTHACRQAGSIHADICRQTARQAEIHTGITDAVPIKHYWPSVPYQRHGGPHRWPNDSVRIVCERLWVRSPPCLVVPKNRNGTICFLAWHSAYIYVDMWQLAPCLIVYIYSRDERSESQLQALNPNWNEIKLVIRTDRPADRKQAQFPDHVTPTLCILLY